MNNMPFIRNIKEVCSIEYEGFLYHAGKLCIIAKDPMAGNKHRYSVICIDYGSEFVTTVGRELPLRESRKVVNKLKKKLKEVYNCKIYEKKYNI